MISRQKNWSEEAKLLWYIAKKFERLRQIAANPSTTTTTTTVP